MNIVKNTPIAISGLMLALFSIASHLNNYINGINIPIGFAAFIILILLILKIILYSNECKNEFDNIVVSSTSGTFSMALMMFSTYFLNINKLLSFTIWIMAVLLHASLIIYFTYKYIYHNYSLDNVYPSYWIVYVGISMASITGSAYMSNYNYIFFIFGFIMMIITLPLVTYRYIKKPIKNDSFKPLICIYTAILSILLVAYLNSYASVSYSFLSIIYIFATVFYIFALYKFIEYRYLAFYPSYSAFSFPFVISLIATYKIHIIFNCQLTSYLLIIETAIAIICVGYVLYSYLTNIYLKNLI